ncbi:MAG: hypothetical protein ACKVVT_04505 [Dehalococcoidia bacterium]
MRFLLVPSPLTGPSSFEPLARALGAGAHVLTPRPPAAPPYWETWANSAVASAPRHAVDDGEPAVLIGHSGAGPGLPAIAPRLSELGVAVAGVVYLDATLPGAYRSWLASYTDAAGDLAAQAAARGGAVPNPWGDPRRWVALGVEADAARSLAAEAEDLPYDWYAEPYPLTLRHDSAAAFTAFEPNAFYRPMVERAMAAGWAVAALRGHHFHHLTLPDEVAETIHALTSGWREPRPRRPPGV